MQRLEEKMEQLAVDKAVADEAYVEQPEPGLTDDGMMQAMQGGMEEPPAIATDEQERIEVAGLGDATKWMAKRVEAAEKRSGFEIPDEPVQTIGGTIVIKAADEQDVVKFNEALGGDYTKGLNFPKIAEQMGDFDLAKYMQDLKNANAEVFERARGGTITFDALLQGAEKMGIDNIVYDFLKRNPRTPGTAEELLGGLIGSMQLMDATDEAFAAATKMPAGEARDAAMVRATQLAGAQSVLLANVSGGFSEAGRSMFVASQAGQKLTPAMLAERSAQLKGLFSTDNVQDIEHIGQLYMNLPNPRSKAQFVKNGWNKSMDVITEVWINSILSGPVTHAVNIAGNTSFQALRLLETGVAAGIGKARSTITGNKSRVRARETTAQLIAMQQALGDAIVLAGRVMKTEEPMDMASKIDVRNRRAIGTTGDLGEIANQIKKGNMLAGAVNTLGVVVRAPGRLLLAEDEFFKAIAYRVAVRQEAIMRSGDLYDQLIDTGATKAEATKKAALLEHEIINKTPDDVISNAREAAKVMTFQEDLDGFLASAQGLSSNPIAKLFIPFFKTPTNVIGETMKRTPLPLFTPKFWQTIRAGGRDADIAMSKVATGSSIGASFAYLAMGNENANFFISGKGPKDRAARDALARKGVQPYSINIKNFREDGTWDGSYTSTTYSRFDPLSGILAMSADFAYYAQHENDPNVLANIAMAMTDGIFNYAGQMPFLQGAAEMTAMFRDMDNLGPAAAEMFAKKISEAGLSVAMGGMSSSAAATYERMGKPGEGASGPTIGSSMMPEEGLFGEDPTELPAFARGFYQALQKAKARNPFFSDEVEPRLNLWGEKMMAGSGETWEAFSPIRIQNTVYSDVDDELVRLGQGIPMPGKRYNGILYNAKQYNYVLETMNTIDAQGRFPGEKGYNSATTLLPILSSLINDPHYASMESNEQKLDKIKSIVAKVKGTAINTLIETDKSFKLKTTAVQLKR